MSNKRFQLTAHSNAFEVFQPEGIKATAGGETFEEATQHLQAWANVEGKDIQDWTITVVDTAAAGATVAPAAKLGTQTGSLVNHLYSGSKMPAPEVGMGATRLCWSDRHAATIVEVSKSGKALAIVEDIATRIDKNGMSESQEYTFAPGTGSPVWYTLRKNGAWVRKGDSIKGERLAVGGRSEYHDFSF